MKALVTVEVSHDGKAKALITKVTDPADKEFNNTVRPPENLSSNQRNTLFLKRNRYHWYETC